MRLTEINIFPLQKKELGHWALCYGLNCSH